MIQPVVLCGGSGMLGPRTFMLAENQSVDIPSGTLHRLHNPGTDPVEVIEVQLGDYLGEDDIVRFEDAYGRAVTGLAPLAGQEVALQVPYVRSAE